MSKSPLNDQVVELTSSVADENIAVIIGAAQKLPERSKGRVELTVRTTGSKQLHSSYYDRLGKQAVEAGLLFVRYDDSDKAQAAFVFVRKQ